MTAAKQSMAAAAAVLTAGGAGVFVDNSGITHGASDWLALLDSADNGGAYWAFFVVPTLGAATSVLPTATSESLWA